jgi:hypothetical protein
MAILPDNIGSQHRAAMHSLAGAQPTTGRSAWIAGTDGSGALSGSKTTPPRTPLPVPRHETSWDDAGRLSGEIDLEVWLVVGCLEAFPS